MQFISVKKKYLTYMLSYSRMLKADAIVTIRQRSVAWKRSWNRDYYMISTENC